MQLSQISFKKILWRYKQPLTKIPATANASCSDLFIWRSDENWQTFFELIDMLALFLNNTEKQRKARLLIFDNKGVLYSEQEVEIQPHRRNRICLSNFIKQIKCSFGTFAIFHLNVADVIIKADAYLTDRGYVSYQYKNAPLNNYVHGNFDAIATHKQKRFELLGGHSFLMRRYYLQYLLESHYAYEIALVNITHKIQKITFILISAVNHNILSSEEISINSGAVVIFPIKVDNIAKRLIIKSKIVMARPIIYAYYNNKIDVLHG